MTWKRRKTGRICNYPVPGVGMVTRDVHPEVCKWHSGDPLCRGCSYYGNPEGNEQVDEFTVEDCWKNIDRYKNRRKSCTRGETEQVRDVIKVAHYAQFIFDKLCEEKGIEKIYPDGGESNE